MLENKVIEELKVLALEAIENAGSGHSGSCLSCGDALYVLYTRHLMSDGTNSPLRDRFVLSNGHSCAVLYSILAGLDYFDIGEMSGFRQFGHMLTGHPELEIPGIDCATGPLGQGVANAVGMAIAETILNDRFGAEHYTYCMAGDGCLEEGVAMEALSVAGLYRLNKFILLYDKNNITLDGDLSMSSTDDVAMKFKAMNFNVIECDGHNIAKIDRAITKAKTEKDKPTVIILNTIIAKGTSLENSHLSHGKVFSKDEIAEYRKAKSIDSPHLNLSEDVKSFLKEIKQRKNEEFSKKVVIFNEKIAKNVKNKKIYKKFLENDFNYTAKVKTQKYSTRVANGIVLNEISKSVENLITLSADLSSSTKVRIVDGGDYSVKNRSGRNIAVGIREHAMGAIANGIALHGGLIPVVSTFLTFSNYMMPAIRMASMMKLKVMFAFTHSSVYDTNDGITHLPVEQIDQLRLIPDMTVFRPADICECVSCYDWFLSNNGPMCVSLSRGELDVITQDLDSSRGAYFITKDKAIANIMASGSELGIAMKVREILKDKIKLNVISVPSLEVFDRQTKQYKNTILNKPTFVIESSTAVKYLKYTTEDKIFNVISFGATGDEWNLKKKYGFIEETIATKIQKILNK